MIKSDMAAQFVLEKQATLHAAEELADKSRLDYWRALADARDAGVTLTQLEKLTGQQRANIVRQVKRVREMA
jgi:hypothetical protein